MGIRSTPPNVLGARATNRRPPDTLSEAQRLYREGRSRSLADARFDEDSLERADRTRLEIVKAMAQFDLGEVTSSLARLGSVVGDEANDPASRFEACLALFLRVSDFEAPDDLLPYLTDLRQLSALSGNARSLASLHLAVARLEGLRGLFPDAHRHLRLSRRLASLGDDQALACTLDLVEGSLECLSGNLLRSKALGERGYQLAEDAKFSKYVLGFSTNLSVLALYMGQSGRARQHLDAIVPAASELTYVRFGALDTLAQVELYDSQTKQCAAAIERCRVTASLDRLPARSWYDLAHQVTRCSYHEYLGDWDHIVEIVDEAGPEVARRQYKTVHTSLLCAKARALAHLGRYDQADAELATAVRICPRSAVDPLIVLEASKGLCATLQGESRAGAIHFDRALAGCQAIGHRYHEKWIRTIRDRATRRGQIAVPPRPPLDTTEAALILNDVATVLGAGHSIELMAHRATSVIENTGMRSRVTIDRESNCEYQADPSASWEATSDGSVQIRLRGSDQRIDIRIAQVRSIEEFSLLKNLADIVQAGVSRTTNTEHEDADQNLWPLAVVATDDDAVFRSPRMIELLKIAMKLASTDLPVLITGETGTGKEIFARLIHENSRVRRGPFVPFNCATVPRDLVESQLFGHRRGAFTGANESFAGLIRSAEKGTLFLDEEGDLDLGTQPKLLRFLESGEIQPLGELRPQRIGVRLVAATNANLETLARDGRFRQDLLYRLGTVLVLPPLRERKDEIPALASFFLARSAAECGRTGVKLADEFVAALLLYDWPGNIRELANEIRRAVALADDGQTLGAQHLAPVIARLWQARPEAGRPTADPAAGIQVRLDQTLAQAISELEERFIAHALQSTGGRVAEAAQLLGLSRKGLFLKRRRRGLARTIDETTAAEG